MFKKLKQSKILATEKQSLELPICRHESSTHECNLIQILKEKQTELKLLINEISSYETEIDNSKSISKFIEFLELLESSGLKMGNSAYPNYPNSKIIRSILSTSYGMYEFNNALDYLSISDIDLIANELKNLKQNHKVLFEKRAIKKQLIQDIEDIKEKLGIE